VNDVIRRAGEQRADDTHSRWPDLCTIVTRRVPRCCALRFHVHPPHCELEFAVEGDAQVRLVVCHSEAVKRPHRTSM
jgi:hypothetical protein